MKAWLAKSVAVAAAIVSINTASAASVLFDFTGIGDVFVQDYGLPTEGGAIDITGPSFSETLNVINSSGMDLTIRAVLAVDQPNDGLINQIAELVIDGPSPGEIYRTDAATPGAPSTALFYFLLPAAFDGTDASSTLTFTATGSLGLADGFEIQMSAVPVPAAGVLFGSALLGAAALRRRKLQQKLGLPQ